MTIDELDLVPEVRAKAELLLKQHPGTIFTSGRRTLESQAHAMAQNIVTSKKRNWIALTYSNSLSIRLLNGWVMNHPNAVTIEEITAGLAEAMKSLTPTQQSWISRHLTGRAFDVQPQSCPVAAIEALQPELFLTREGNLARWHVQF